MKQRPSLPNLGEETVPPDEPEQIEEMVKIMRSIQEAKDRREQPVPRDVHPKQHGCVRAELTVESWLPDHLRHGVFREGLTYPALVRFSNSKQRNDQLPDAHGMAIKLLEVEGRKLLENEGDAKTQDFVLIDHPVFFAKAVADFLPLVRDFRRLMIGGVFSKAATGLKGAFSQDYRYRLLRQTAAKRPDSPLRIQYWSTTPYKLGQSAMKISLRPQFDAIAPQPSASANKLREAMAAHLRDREARFDFLAQVQTDATTMPIEDATVEWPEADAPFEKVATLRILRQTFEADAQLRFGENLFFTPWHGLQEHRPLGGINRARRMIYEVMSARRLELNGVPKREPALEDVRALWP